jgi:hypothetical protein
MGYGEFGGNGSIHWKIGHGIGNGSSFGSGADPIPNANVGQGHGKQGEFQIEITYATADAAQKAYAAAAPRANVITLNVVANTGNYPKGDVPTQIAVKW